MTNPIPLSRATRTSVMLSADIFRMGQAQPSQHRVTNISETGICIRQADMLATGSVVAVAIGRIEPVAADVVWVRGDLAGLAFKAPIDVAQARLRRMAGGTIAAPAAGWLADLNDPYGG